MGPNARTLKKFVLTIVPYTYFNVDFRGDVSALMGISGETEPFRTMTRLFSPRTEREGGEGDSSSLRAVFFFLFFFLLKLNKFLFYHMSIFIRMKRIIIQYKICNERLNLVSGKGS